jgi:hypothetical protein
MTLDAPALYGRFVAVAFLTMIPLATRLIRSNRVPGDKTTRRKK